MSSSDEEAQQLAALKYQMLTQHEHILKRPDTYVGDISLVQENVYVHDRESNSIVSKLVSYSPALFKITDEILVNAADNKQRCPDSTTLISASVNPFTGEISVTNNGHSIPLILHPQYKIHVPEVIFGNLLSGDNFDDNVERTTGGRNGFGAKLANVYSKRMVIHIVHCGKEYTQLFENNMYDIHPPEIRDFVPAPGEEIDENINVAKLRGAKKDAWVHRYDRVSVSFVPDYARLNMTVPSEESPLSEGLVALFRRRVIDLAGTMTRYSSKSNATAGLKVSFSERSVNGSELYSSSFQFKSFREYLMLYKDLVGESGEKLVFSERINDHWEVAVAVGEGDNFQQVSFVNCINTMKGGTHVKHVLDQVITYIQETVCVKKKIPKMKAASIKPFLTLFVNAVIVNPQFDQQTKIVLSTTVNHFKPLKCVLADEKCMEKLIQSHELIELLSHRSNKTQDLEFSKAMTGSKRDNLSDIPKLADASFAGTNKGHLCTFVVTEGDSAFALFTSGRKVVGSDYYGGIPARGKTVNVRGAKYDAIMKNKELHNIVRILGLKYGKEYKTEADIRTLRYGHFMCMTDQDNDGSHIKGLLINFFEYFWPSLLAYPTFLQDFQTPLKKGILTVKKFSGLPEKLSFFTENEYRKWMESVGPDIAACYKVKYYKGLGTSTATEACEYFCDIANHMYNFDLQGEEVDEDNSEATKARDLIDMAFNNKRANDRKQWLLQHNSTDEVKVRFVEHEVVNGAGKSATTQKVVAKHVSLSDFINVNLREFSNADLERSVGNLFDGLKPSQRKILFACFKRNLKEEIKVSQLAGYVSEHAAYHHGEMSLCSAIVGMAQNFAGANNIPLLCPAGQFGTRSTGGKDAASSRYIFTRLEKITRFLFSVHDDPLLNYLEDDGQKVEPEYYLPIIPTILVNGCSGVGTGWSTEITQYNPRDLISKVREYIACRKEDQEWLYPTKTTQYSLKPWFRGFGGIIHPYDEENERYAVDGRIERVDGDCTKFRIFEVPIGTYAQEYKLVLKSWDLNLSGGVAAAGNDDNRSTNSENNKKGGGDTAKSDFRFITNIRENITDDTVEFIVQCDEYALYGNGKLSPDANEADLAKFFKLRNYISMRNMHLFNEHGVIERFQSPESIIHRFCGKRWELYGKRKEHLLAQLQREAMIARNKINFITMVADGKLELGRRDRESLEKELKDLQFDPVSEEKGQSDETSGSFEYLLKMPLSSLTKDRILYWTAYREKRDAEVVDMQNKSISDLWTEDLSALEIALRDYEKEREDELNQNLEKAQEYKNKLRGGNHATNKKSGAKRTMVDASLPEVAEVTKSKRTKK